MKFSQQPFKDPHVACTVRLEELANSISSYAVEVLKRHGIEELFPPQAEAVRYVFGRRNLLLCMPTAAGKTLLAELAMVREVIEGGKCLYVVPLKAIANEKFKSFLKWEEIGIRIGISTGDYSSRDEHLADCDIIVTTCEKADSLLRNNASWMRNVSCLVVDELHLIDDADRGVNLEVLIAKMFDRVRIIGLSATVRNYEEIAEWLNADCYVSEWRPVPLYEGTCIGGILEIGGERRRVSLEELVSECGTLVFEPTRRRAEATAEKLARLKLARCEELARKVLAENDGEMSRRLARCVANGVAFHHAGLLASQREVIEDAFRSGELRVIVATPTLAAGVNLPARRVIIRSLYRYDGYPRPIKIMEYKQMAGRAGRPGMDERGEVIIFAKDRRLAEKYIFGEPEPVTSKLASEAKLRFHSLSLICDGYSSVEQLERFFDRTLFSRQNDASLDFVIERVVLQLEKWGMVEYEDRIVPTELGRLVSRLYIDPLTGFIFYDVLRREEPGELGILHLICRTPDMERLYLKKDDDWVEERAFELRDELTYYPSAYSADYDWFLQEVKTALCLYDWINEVDEDEICERYSIAPGDLRRIVETAEWLCSAAERIGKLVGAHIAMSTRLKYGVKEELLELVELYGIGRVRARKLFDAGIRSREDLERNFELAAKLVGRRIIENALSRSPR